MKIKLLFLTLFFNIIANGQDNSPNTLKKNSIYAEIGGNTIHYSVNYERIFYQKKKTHLCGRLGMMVSPFASGSDLWVMIPAEINMLNGKKNNFFETGIGFTYNFTMYEDRKGLDASPYYHTHFIMTRIGYRFQKPTGGFLFRIAVLPQLIYIPEQQFHNPKYQPIVWGGISFGYSF